MCMWIEEPAVPGNIEVFKRLKQQIRMPLATGERDRTIWEVMPVSPASSHRHPSVRLGHCGGISQMKKIATLAETFYTPMAPHNTCSELGLTASLHVSASIPLFLIQEGYIDGHIMPAGVARKSWTQDKEGYASLPQGPGSGRRDRRSAVRQGERRSETQVQVAGADNRRTGRCGIIEAGEERHEITGSGLRFVEVSFSRACRRSSAKAT